MSFPAVRAVFTEALGVGNAIFGARLLVDMKEDTVGSIVAFTVLRPEMAHWHLREVITMQEFTIAVLLAQGIEPMLANRSFDLYVQIRALVVAALTFCKMAAHVL